MATPQNGGPEPWSIIRALSKFAGALVGTAVITGKRIIGEAKSPSKGSSDKPKKKNISAQAKRKKKKAVKRKPAGSSSKSGASQKKPAQSPAKKKKIATPKKTAKNEVSSPSQNGLTSETCAGTNTLIEKQKPSIPIIEYNDKADNAVGTTASVF